MRRHAHVALRRRDEGSRIILDQLLAPEGTQERADGGELARSGRTRVPAAVKLREKPSDGGAIELWRPQLRSLDALPDRDEREKLREIALVGAHRVRRRVAIKPEKLQE